MVHLANSITNDCLISFQKIDSILVNSENLLFKHIICFLNLNSFLDSLSISYFKNNLGFLYSNYDLSLGIMNKNLFMFFLVFFKLSLFFCIIYLIFVFNNFKNYIKQVTTINYLTKFFILNESEKEIGPVEDFFFFVILFSLALCSFVFISFFVLIIHGNVYTWAVGGLLLTSVLILTIPINLFFDFGVSFFVYIRGSSTSTNFIKEFMFDIISTFIVFIRFVVQNIRFLFIFSAIFELLEWVISANSSLFSTNLKTLNCFIINTSINDYFFLNKSTNLLIVNFLMFIVLYFYYAIHLILLLLMQITIYIGISAWLFFFLYSTKFLNKYERYFVFKKNLI